MKELKYEEARAGGAGISCMFLQCTHHVRSETGERERDHDVQLHYVACTSPYSVERT